MLGKLLGGLFGGKEGAPAKAAEALEYEGYSIYAEPRSQGGQWQVAGRIEKAGDGEPKVHVLIRADLLPSKDEAAEVTIRKAKLMIDQQGDGIFQ